MQARIFFCLCLSVLALTGSLGAKDGLAIQSVNTVTGRYVLNHRWNLAVVAVENTGDKPARAGVRLQLGAQPNRFVRVCSFPAKSVTKVYIPVYADFSDAENEKALRPQVEKLSFPDGVKRQFTRWHGKLPCGAALVDLGSGMESGRFSDSLFAVRDGFALELAGDDQQEPLPLAFQSETGLPRILGTEPRYDRRYNISAVPLAGALVNGNYPDDSFEDSARFYNVDPESLSSDPLFWQGPRLCLCNGVKWRDGVRGLTPMQKHALREWVNAGGRLVVMPSCGIADFQDDAFWTALLPVSLTGVRQFTEADGAALARWLGAKPVPAEARGREIASARPGNDGETLVAAGGEVLLARRPCGAGEVWFCAFPGAFLQEWSDGQLLFRRFLTLPAAADAGVEGTLRAQAGAMLQTLMGLPAPAKSSITAIMLAYLIIATLLLVILRLRRRAEWGWPLLLGVAAVFFGVGFGLLRAARARAGLPSAEIGITRVSGETARNTTYFGLNAPEDVTAAVKMGAPGRLAVCPPAKESAVKAAFTVRQDKVPQVEKFNLHLEEFWGGAVASEIPADIFAEVSFDEKGLTGRVVNRGKTAYDGAILHYQRRGWKVGDIGAGAKVEIAGKPQTWELLPESAGSANQTKIRHALVAYSRNTGGRDPQLGAPILYAFSQRHYAKFALGETASEPAAYQLCALTPRLVPPRPGAKITLPAGVCRLEFTGGGSYFGVSRPAAPQAGGLAAEMGAASTAEVKEPAAPPAALPGWRSGAGNLRLQVRFVPPVKIAPEKGVLYFKGSLKGLRGELGVRKPGAEKFTTLKKIPSGAQDVALPVKDLSQYRVGGVWPEFELRTLPEAGKNLLECAWKIEVFDLEITGTAEE